MKEKMVFVIQNEEGNCISPRAFTLTDEGWVYHVFTGKTTGFTFYSDWALSTAEEELKKL